jgi:hypothetical protein
MDLAGSLFKNGREKRKTRKARRAEPKQNETEKVE